MASTAPATNILNGYPIRNFDTSDPGATAWANEIKGGHHQKLTLVERDAITVQRREIGMTCYVEETQLTYQLQGGISNLDWKDLLDIDDQDIADLEQRMTDVEADVLVIQQTQTAGYAKGYATKALMDADLVPGDGSLAIVTNDSISANNGTYRKTGATGTGSWIKASDDLYGRVQAVEVKTEDDSVGSSFVEGRRVVRAWQDPQGRKPVLLWDNGVTRLQKLNVKAFDNLSEVKGLLGIGVAPATMGEVALGKYSAGNPLTPWEALAMAAYRKIDVVMVGDSNQLHSGDGWDNGWGKAFGARWKMHSSPLYFTQRTSVGYSTSAQSIGPEMDPVPDPYKPYFIKCTQLADGVTDTNGAGIIVNADSKLDVNSALRWECLYGTTDTGAGSFRPGYRRESTPFTPGAWGTTVNTNTGTVGVARVTYDLAAATRNYAIKMGGQIQGSTTPTGTATGPVTMFCERIIDTLATVGFSATTWIAEAGQGLWDMLGIIQGYDRSAAIAFFTELRRVQAATTGRPVFVFILNSGLNDRNNTADEISRGWREIGGTAALSSGPGAYEDNMEAVIDYVESIWESQGGNGWRLEELHWIVIPSHRIADPDDPKLVSYRKASRSAISKRQRCVVVDIGQIMTQAEGLANGWYEPGPDFIHMDVTGHQAIAERIMVQNGL